MKQTMEVGVALVASVSLVIALSQAEPQTAGAQARQTPAREVPIFQADPSWPKIPSKWVLGQVASVAVDAQDHVWIL